MPSVSTNWHSVTLPRNKDSYPFFLQDEKDAQKVDEEENAEDEEPEFWDYFPEAILDDLSKEQPLPEPRDKSTVSKKKMTSLPQWLTFFSSFSGKQIAKLATMGLNGFFVSFFSSCIWLAQHVIVNILLNSALCSQVPLTYYFNSLT